MKALARILIVMCCLYGGILFGAVALGVLQCLLTGDAKFTIGDQYWEKLVAIIPGATLATVALHMTDPQSQPPTEAGRDGE